jgi:hypothetical protein
MFLFSVEYKLLTRLADKHLSLLGQLHLVQALRRKFFFLVFFLALLKFTPLVLPPGCTQPKFMRPSVPAQALAGKSSVVYFH